MKKSLKKSLTSITVGMFMMSLFGVFAFTVLSNTGEDLPDKKIASAYHLLGEDLPDKKVA